MLSQVSTTVGLLSLLVVGLFAPISGASVFEPGDLVLVRGLIQGCDGPSTLLDYGQVSSEGVVTLFENRMAHARIEFPVTGKSPSEVREALVSLIEEREGYRPESLAVTRLTIAEYIEMRRGGKVLRPDDRCRNRLIEEFENHRMRPEQWQERETSPGDFRITRASRPPAGRSAGLRTSCSVTLTSAEFSFRGRPPMSATAEFRC